MKTEVISLTVNVADAELVYDLFEDKAKHSELVALHQRSISNEKAAANAEARAAMLRTVARPLAELAEQVKQAKIDARVAKVEAQRATKEARAELRKVAKVKKVKSSKPKAGPVVVLKGGDEIRAMAAKSRAKLTHAEKMAIAGNL
jgi:hypothetical protein